MVHIGITGQSGFIGTHLYNTLSLCPGDFKLVPYNRNFFENPDDLQEFVSQCDCIVHLAAKNRHEDAEVLYKTNIKLAKQLIAAMECTGSTPHLLFSSSIQEERDNPYGRSKKKGRELFTEWSRKHEARFSALIIPNVFGPFGDPYYNSVVATFSHQLTHGETPEIKVNADMELIYVGELVREIVSLIRDTGENKTNGRVDISHTATVSVSALLKKLKGFKEKYHEHSIIPDLSTSLDKNLFNTFRSYIDHQNHFPVRYKKHADERGSFVETMRAESGGQFSFSTTKRDITRGNHFHTKKVERFSVIKGKALIKMRRVGTQEILSFEVTGDQPGYVDMPIWYTHNITNIGKGKLYTLFWIDEFYNPDNPDTYYENV